jgi:hypothetical protein
MSNFNNNNNNNNIQDLDLLSAKSPDEFFQILAILEAQDPGNTIGRMSLENAAACGISLEQAAALPVWSWKKQNTVEDLTPPVNLFECCNIPELIKGDKYHFMRGKVPCPPKYTPEKPQKIKRQTNMPDGISFLAGELFPELDQEIEEAIELEQKINMEQALELEAACINLLGMQQYEPEQEINMEQIYCDGCGSFGCIGEHPCNDCGQLTDCGHNECFKCYADAVNHAWEENEDLHFMYSDDEE